MAIGYSKLISRFQDVFFEDWLHFVERSFELNLETALKYVDENGDEQYLRISEMKEILFTTSHTTIKFLVNVNTFVIVTISIIDGFLISEDYSFDEVLEESVYEKIYIALFKRFNECYNNGIGVGFIFDKDGYSEDYIKVG